MEKLYGYGINRRLKPGEEATVMENIRKILEKCEKNPEFFQYSVNTAVKKIFKKCDLENLMHFPLCYKQVETHWKIMATRFRCSGDLFLKNRKFERILSSSQAKNHFVNLNQENSILAAYLLKYSQKLSSY